MNANRANAAVQAFAGNAAPGRIMRLTTSRIAYWGAFGRPSVRKLGAWTLYVAIERPFDLSENGGPVRCETVALVAPWVSHRVATEDHDLALIVIEPETVDPLLLVSRLMGTRERQQATAAAIRLGFQQGPGAPEDFDLQYFGEALPRRAKLDARIRRVVEQVGSPGAPNLTAQACAAQACLSFSRFLHLFSREMQTTFRRLRAWKRARGLLWVMGGDPSLVDVALEAGYADSTHFSRSVRRCYGYTPSAMFDLSRRLPVIAQGAPQAD